MIRKVQIDTLRYHSCDITFPPVVSAKLDPSIGIGFNFNASIKDWSHYAYRHSNC